MKKYIYIICLITIQLSYANGNSKCRLIKGVIYEDTFNGTPIPLNKLELDNPKIYVKGKYRGVYVRDTFHLKLPESAFKIHQKIEILFNSNNYILDSPCVYSIRDGDNLIYIKVIRINPPFKIITGEVKTKVIDGSEVSLEGVKIEILNNINLKTYALSDQEGKYTLKIPITNETPCGYSTLYLRYTCNESFNAIYPGIVNIKLCDTNQYIPDKVYYLTKIHSNNIETCEELDNKNQEKYYEQKASNQVLLLQKKLMTVANTNKNKLPHQREIAIKQILKLFASPSCKIQISYPCGINEFCLRTQDVEAYLRGLLREGRWVILDFDSVHTEKVLSDRPNYFKYEITFGQNIIIKKNGQVYADSTVKRIEVYLNNQVSSSQLDNQEPKLCDAKVLYTRIINKPKDIIKQD